jgi:hypothetical protein
MAVDQDTPPALLPCGRDPLVVWDHADEHRLGPHERSCPYCQGVVDEHAVLSGTTSRYLAVPLEPPASLLERVMQSVRAAMRVGDVLPLASPLGPVTLDQAAASTVVRYAADQIPGVRARSCRIEPRSDGAAARDPVDIGLTISGADGADLRSLAQDTRAVVIGVARDLLGLEVGVVDIEVVDIFAPPAGAGKEEP